MLYDLASNLTGPDEIHVITSRLLYSKNGRSLPSCERIESIQVHRVWTSAFGRESTGRIFDYVTFYVAAMLKVGRLARHGDVVVAKTDPPVLSIAAAIVTQIKRARLVNWLQDLFPEIVERVSTRKWVGALLRPLRTMRNWSLRHAAANVAIGSRMRALLLSSGVPPEKVTVIHNWADGEEVVPIAPASNQLRGEWGLRDHFVVGYSGNLGRVHELDTIVEAAQRLHAKANLTFLFIGDGFQRKRLETECLSRGLKNVMFKPYVARSEIGTSLTVPNVHLVSLHPAFEGLVVPSKIYGAMAAGVPVIFIGDVSGEAADLLLSPPPAGIIVGSRDADALVAAVSLLESNREIASDMGKAGRERFLCNFERKVALSLWETLLARL